MPLPAVIVAVLEYAEAALTAATEYAASFSSVDSPETHGPKDEDATLRFEWVEMVDHVSYLGGTYWVPVVRINPASPASPEKEAPAKRQQGILLAEAGGPTVVDTGQPFHAVPTPQTGTAPAPYGILSSEPWAAASPPEPVSQSPAPQSDEEQQVRGPAFSFAAPASDAGNASVPLAEDAGTPPTVPPSAPAVVWQGIEGRRPLESGPESFRPGAEIPLIPGKDLAEARRLAETFKDPDDWVYMGETQRQHQRKVVFVINLLLREAAARIAPGKDPRDWTPAERRAILQTARNYAEHFRGGDSENRIKRDAEYYLVARYLSVGFMDRHGYLPRVAVLAGGMAAHGIYAASVVVSNTWGWAGGRYFMRTGPEPNAPVGGFVWTAAGNEDSKKDFSAESQAAGWDGVYVKEPAGLPRFNPFYHDP